MFHPVLGTGLYRPVLLLQSLSTLTVHILQMRKVRHSKARTCPRTPEMQSRDVNPGSPALEPAFLMTLSPGSEERVRRGAVHNGTLPRERRFFRDAETVKRGTKQSPPLCPTAKSWSCAHLLLSLFQPPLSSVFLSPPPSC